MWDPHGRERKREEARGKTEERRRAKMGCWRGDEDLGGGDAARAAATTTGKKIGLAAAMATQRRPEETEASIGTMTVTASHWDGWATGGQRKRRCDDGRRWRRTATTAARHDNGETARREGIGRGDSGTQGDAHGTAKVLTGGEIRGRAARVVLGKK